MYLKKIEFQGFKSFVDPTALSFEPGISGIIGPNGCGKSNVSDAIRWVMGEQSAKALRGSKMMDVIFNGTEGRKPAGMAEVTLTISNEDRALAVDYAEVSLTRRSYRDGSSEYLINQAPSRLKDIHALLADTGLGTDGYSLLEQGKLDLILSSKPMDRRSVFEEAAGITKYKTQRDEALRKLEATDLNLSRVNDIVGEVKRQIGSLERQAKRAEKYQALKTELDRLRGGLILGDVREARARRAELDAEGSRLSLESEGLDARMKERDAQSAALRLDLTHDEEALSAANRELSTLDSQAAGLDRQRELNLAQISNLEERGRRALADAGDLRGREASLNEELGQARTRVAEEESALGGLKDALARSEGAHREASGRRQERSAEAQALQQRLIQSMDLKGAVKAESEALRGRVAMLESRAKQIEGELGAAQESLAEAGRRLEEAAAQAGAKGEEVRSLEGLLGDQYLRRLELEEAVRAAEEGVHAGQVRLGSERARLATLEELARALEGYDAGPKALLKAAAAGKSPVPVDSLAQRVRLSRPEAEAAVELALDKRLQALVAASEADALACLEWLKETRQGRAAVVPKDAMRAARPVFPPELLARDGVLGPLTGFLEADPGYEPALDWLAGGLLLTKDLASARGAAPLLPPGCEAVSLDGWLVSAEGTLSGGSGWEASRGLLSREREMASLKRDIESGEERLARLRDDRERLRGELGELSRSIEQQNRQKSDLEIAVARLQKEQGARQDDVRRLSHESEEKRKAIEAVQVEVAGFRGSLETLKGRLAEAEAAEAGLQGELNVVLDAINVLRADEEAQLKAVNEQRVAQAGCEQRLQNHRVAVQRLAQEAASASEQAQRREGEAAAASREQQALAEANTRIEADLKAVFERRTAAQGRLAAAVEARQARIDALAAVEEGLRALRNEGAALAASRHELDLRVQELAIRLEGLERTLAAEFHVDLAALDEAQLFGGGEGPAPEPEAARARVAELSAKIAELGVVNPAAAEEYRELEQRHSLLVGQLEDLRTAKNDLMKVIHTINQESRERFMATFEKVHESFKRTFRTLFGGGEAQLALLEEGDLLEAGIDIIARPPGKRQQSISLLSGGEKALTATALLFALFETKPSPFCVLDEIDAPLDDANIGRFCDLLVRYAEKTQFIVITHSKITMERADVIYGVTMEEAGVSRIISAKFKEDRAVTA